LEPTTEIITQNLRSCSGH